MPHLSSTSKVCLTRFKINLQVKFAGTHLLGKACSASPLQ